MKLKVEDDKITIEEDSIIRAESIAIYDIEIDFSEVWNEFPTKEIIFTNGEHTYEREIVDNVADFPSIPNGIYEIGIVGYIIENDVIVKRKPTNMVVKQITNSSAEYEVNQADEEKEVSVIQKKIEELEKGLSDLKSILDDYTDEKVIEISQRSDVYNKNEIDTKLENYLQFEEVEEINE